MGPKYSVEGRTCEETRKFPLPRTDILAVGGQGHTAPDWGLAGIGGSGFGYGIALSIALGLSVVHGSSQQGSVTILSRPHVAQESQQVLRIVHVDGRISL